MWPTSGIADTSLATAVGSFGCSGVASAIGSGDGSKPAADGLVRTVPTSGATPGVAEVALSGQHACEVSFYSEPGSCMILTL